RSSHEGLTAGTKVTKKYETRRNEDHEEEPIKIFLRVLRVLRGSPLRPSLLQRRQERQQRLLIVHAQVPEAEARRGRFVVVTQDRVGERQRRGVVHEAVVRPQAPQRRRSQFVRGRGCLHDAVAGADVVQQEVAERVNRLVAERGGHDERPAVDGRPGGGGGN